MKLEIMGCPVTAESGAEGMLSLVAVTGEDVVNPKNGSREFHILFCEKGKRNKRLLRNFPSGACLKAVRSFRRMVLLSDELKAGY